MKGIELSRRFYLEHGAPMLEREFGEYVGVIAVGLVGSGSECFGFDDDISQDHDFEPGFCLFLPDEDVVDRKTAFLLERAYARLPSEFMGYKRCALSPVGGNRHGVLRMREFFFEKLGAFDGRLTKEAWFSVPEQSLAEATNGEVFRDDLGWFEEIRRSISYFPEDVRRKKLAGNLLVMGQAGQYNFERCERRGERAAAQLALNEFVNASLKCIFLLNRRYMPYYKWSFRALTSLGLLSDLYGELELLLTGGAQSSFADKTNAINRVVDAIVYALKEQKLTSYMGNTMEGHACSVNDRIEDGEIRNLHIMFAV